MFLRKSLFAILTVILASGAVAFAQDPQTPSLQDDALRQERTERRERRRERIGRSDKMGGPRAGRHGMGPWMRDLNLTEEQKEQSRAIMQRRMDSTKLQREELFRLREKRLAGTFTPEDGARAETLQQEIRNAMKGGREEMAGVLTAEQKAKIEQLKQERKTKFQQRKKERQERLNNRPL